MPNNSNSFGSIPDSVTQRAMSYNISVEEKTRREQMIINKNFYYGKQEDQLTLVNEDVDPVILNLTQPIVKKRSTLLYKKSIKREFEGSAQSISFLEQVYKDNDIDTLMKSADLGSELTGTSVILVVDDENKESGIRLSLYDSSQFSVISDQLNPLDADALSLVRLVHRFAPRSTPNNPQVETVLEQQIWTNRSIVTVNSGEKDSLKMQNTTSNELGFIPFVALRTEPVHDQFLGHAPTTSLRKLNQSINQSLTNLSYAIKMQGASPIALIGYESGEGITLHPGRAFSLPTGASAEALSLDPKIEPMLQVVRYLEEKAFETNSVPKVAVVGGEGTSGRELMIRFFPLLQVFQDKSVEFKKSELELANMILKISGLEPVESISIDYPEDSILPFSADEDRLDNDIELNLRTPLDELMKRNPELTEIEAEAELRANRELNIALSPTVQSQE